MRSWTIALLFGVVLFQLQAAPPSTTALLLLLALALGLLLWRRYRPVRLAVVLLGGFLWSGWHAQALLAQQLSPSQEGQDIELTGWVASLPVSEERRTRFELEVEQVEVAEPVTFPRRLAISWYNDAPALRPGDHCRLVVRLKRPWGSLNPGGSDYEQWLFRQGVRATGYVRQGVVLESGWRYPLQRVRSAIHDQLATLLAGREQAGIIIALALGERQGIDKAQWQTFAATGTTHLIAVSGLHISLVAGLTFFLARWLWSRSSRCALRWPAPRVAALNAFLAALLYAALSGFGVPVQRALVMVALVLGAVGLRPAVVTSRVLALALLAILAIAPLEVLGVGLWLSFGSVALLLYAMQGRLATRGHWWRWGRVHWVAGFGLLPLLVLFFQQAPLTSPLANLVAVPWVGMVVVPLSLMGTLLSAVNPAVGEWPLLLAAWALELLWPLLEWLAHWQPAVALAAPGWTLLLAGLAVIWLLAPRGWPMRWAGLALLLPVLLVRPERPTEGEAWFTLLDVGQGLSAVVQTRDHVLVFDTGLAFSGGSDSGSNVILPFLRQQGWGAIDALVVSHGDSDHIGGMATLLALGEVRRLLTSVPEKMPAERAYELCRAGQKWQWDGVTFEMVHPHQTQAGRGNDDSCVLRVSGRGLSVLLTGDIEAKAERELLGRSPQLLQADLLVAPHHGSKTSSTTRFIEAVAPRWVLFPTGYRNRYRFPVASIVARYREAGVAMLETAHSGAITVRPGPFNDLTIEEYRKTARHYWHSEPLH